ncbi:anhydro-N-acetylmuramic acid kinase, partial [Escherichia coli]|nr:anhydro-N-acetylmuramic acid kinase [Escherichia coli]
MAPTGSLQGSSLPPDDGGGMSAGGHDMLVLGYMSGTSLDGVDAALVETDGERIAGFGPGFLSPYTDTERATVERATADALAWNG